MDQARQTGISVEIHFLELRLLPRSALRQATGGEGEAILNRVRKKVERQFLDVGKGRLYSGK